MAELKGLMIFFNDYESLKKMHEEERLRFLDSMFEYAEYGVMPDFSDYPRSDTAWEFMKPQIDRDKKNYQEKCKRNAYAIYKRWCSEKGETPLSYPDWIRDEYE